MEACKKRCSTWIQRTRYWENKRRENARRRRWQEAREYWDLIRLERRALPPPRRENTEAELDAFHEAWENRNNPPIIANMDAVNTPLPDDPFEPEVDEPLGEGEGEYFPPRPPARREHVPITRPHPRNEIIQGTRRDSPVRSSIPNPVREHTSINRHITGNVRDNRVNRHVKPALKLKIPGPLQHKSQRVNPHTKGAKVVRTNPISYRKKKYYRYN